MIRVPEHEVMDDLPEIEAYDALSRNYLKTVETFFTKRARCLLKKKTLRVR